MFLRIAICFLLMLLIVDSKLLQLPEDGEAVIGQNQVVLSCRTDVTNSPNPVEWHHKANKDDVFEIVYKRRLILNGYRGRFKVLPNATSGQFDLIITGVQLEDAGAYTCMDKDSQHKAELIVFEKYPSNISCMANSPSDGFLGSNNCGLEPDIVRMSCDLSYRGNLVPVLEWMDGENVIPSNITKDAFGVTRSSIEQQADQHQTYTFTCRIKYHDSMITSSFAWSSTVNIRSITNATNLSYVGCELESLDCSDVINGECSYTWLSENGTELGHNAAVKMRGKSDGNYTCLAKCKVRQTPCSYVAKYLNYQCSHYSYSSTASPRTLAFKLCISVGILLPVVAITMMILAFLFRRLLCTCQERCLNNSNGSEAEKGQNNCLAIVTLTDEMSPEDFEVEKGQNCCLTIVPPTDEMSPQEPFVSPTKNSEKKKINIFGNGATSIKEMPEKNSLLQQS